MANPFYVQPANPLQALMAFDQSYQGARKRTQEDEAKAALAQFAQSNPQLGPIAQLIGSGNVPAAQAISNMELARTNADWTRQYQGGMLDLARTKESREANEPKYIPGTDQYGNPTIQIVPKNQPPTTAPIGAAPGQVMPSYSGEQPRMAVSSSNRVVGDEEAVRRGLYDAPTQIAQAGRSPTPQSPPQAPAIPPPPPGVNPRKWIEEHTKARVESDAKAAELQKGGEQVLRMVDQLQSKVNDPLFSGSTGPFVGEVSNDAVWSPQRLLYEATQKRENKAFLDRIRTDAQAINSVMQRNLLKGGGSITEEERKDISKILGAITTARSVEDAKAQLDNFKGIVRKMFGMPEPRLRFNPQTGDFE